MGFVVLCMNIGQQQHVLTNTPWLSQHLRTKAAGQCQLQDVVKEEQR
jgi:hypothetical protein